MKLYQWLPLFALIFSISSSSSSPDKMRGLSKFLKTTQSTIAQSSNSLSEDYKSFFYDQTLDHFNYNPESYATFQQRYVINYKYWGGASSCAPIFAFLGAESSSLYGNIRALGFLTDHAPRFKSLLVYIEHRFYGESVPYGTFDEALKNITLRGYFNSAQALADYAEVLLHIKSNLSATCSPIIVLGGSYGGELAAWFRLKYPHIAYGALASSAPILYFVDIFPKDAYYATISKDYKDISQSCYETIRRSWSIIDNVASKPQGLSILSRKFHTCRPLEYVDELKSYLKYMYVKTAGSDSRSPSNYPVTVVCSGIDGAPKGTDTLGRIFAGIAAYEGNKTCYINTNNNPTQTPSVQITSTKHEDEAQIGWSWQYCSEMVQPAGISGNETMFPVKPFNLSSVYEGCKGGYGVTPRPYWITTYYGGRDIKRVLKNFGSNIIFSNGLRDPWSSGGVLEDISETVRAVTTVNGTHCLDLLGTKPNDPQWLIEQRNTEVQLIDDWLRTYYHDDEQYIASTY